MQEVPAFITIPYQEFKAIIEEVQSLVSEVQSLREEGQTLRGKINALEAHQTAEIERLGRDIAYDRQRLKKLEAPKLQPLQKDRGEILRALIAANGGKMLAKDARQKMHLSRSRFSELLATMGKYIDTKPYHLNKSAKVLILK
jgi:chromosome segregation ATPase